MAFRIRISQPVDASRNLLWHAIAQPEGMQRWQADDVAGESRVGETLRLLWPALGASVDLSVIRIVHGELLQVGAGDSEVTIEVEPGRVTLTHSGLEPGDHAEGMQSSWHVALRCLRHYAERHPGEARTVRWFVRRVQTTAEVAHTFFTDEHAMQSWLTPSGAIGADGEAFELKLQNGESLSGDVLARVDERDVALTWRERGDSVIVLRTLPSPFDVDERLVAIVWSTWGDPDVDDYPFFEAAIDRLGRLLGGGVSA